MSAKAASVKRERFKTVASRRVQKLLDDMDNLSRCANKATYEYSEDDVRKMFKAINDQFYLLKAAFESNSKSGKRNFEF